MTQVPSVREALQLVVPEDRLRSARELPNAFQGEPNVSKFLAARKATYCLGGPHVRQFASALLVDTQGPKDDTKRAKQDASLKETRFKFVMFQPHVAVDVLNQSSLAERRMIPSGVVQMQPWASIPASEVQYS